MNKQTTPLALILLSFLTGILLSACGPTTKISSKDLSFLYKKSAHSISPIYTIFHKNDSISEVHFELKTADLLYSKKEDEHFFLAKVKFKYKLLSSYESNVLHDSASVLISNKTKDLEPSLLRGKFEIKTPEQINYLLEITATDVYRHLDYTTYVDIDKVNRFRRQNFLVISAQDDHTLFRNYFGNEQQLKIKYNNTEENIQIQVHHYDREFPLAPPPFSIYNPKPFNYTADSTFLVELVNGELIIDKPENGYYHFTIDSMRREGLTLYTFSENFPSTKNSLELIEPIRYITSKREYEEVLNADNPKLAIDKFWLENAADENRGKELIKQYYNRVKSANEFFSSYNEGWKTDRGVVYLVFGPPNLIYKTNNSESWVYGEENNFMSMNFNFIQVSNPFTQNDYQLQRSPIYKSNWYRAVDSWRQGRIFLSN